MYAYLGAEAPVAQSKPSTAAPLIWGLLTVTVAAIAVGNVAGEVRALHRDASATGGKKLAATTTKTIGVVVGVALVGLVGWRIAERVGWTKLGPPALLLINQHPLEPPPPFAGHWRVGPYASQAFRWDERHEAWIPVAPPVESASVASVTGMTKGIPQYGSIYGVAKWAWHAEKGRWMYDSTEYGRELTKAVS